MIYNIFDKAAPVMPRPSKGTEFCKLLLSKALKDMREPLIPMVIPALAAHLSGVEFQYCDNNYYELCGQMGHLIGPSGIGKAQLTRLIEAVMRTFRDHDETEYKKLVDWQRQVKTRGANKEKPERPEVCFWFPPADLTNAAFLQNAMALEKMNNRTQFLNLPEVEMADRICGGHKQVSQMVRNIYDCQRAGALRATADGVVGNPILRACLTFSSTPEAARLFYKKDLTNGFFGRIPFAYKKRGERKGLIPRQGNYYDGKFLAQLDSYLKLLDDCKGRFVVKPLNKIADQLAEDMARLADLADDDMLFELSHRSIFAAWKKGALLWILNNQTWTRSMGEFVIWFCFYDLWSKVKVFGDMFKITDEQADETQKCGPKNMLSNLETSFNESQLEALRISLGKSREGTRHQLSVWQNRGFITYSAQTGLYTKTKEYLKGSGLTVKG